MIARRTTLPVCAVLATAGLVAIAACISADERKASTSSADQIDFAKDVRPILQAKCHDCHGPSKQKGGIRLDQPTALKGGDSNEPLLIAGDTAKSHILRLVRGDGDEVMPPKKADRLSAEQVDVLTRWVKQGGQWPADSAVAATPTKTAHKHWSFNPPTRPAVPDAKDLGTVRNPIDPFILARLAKENLKQSPEADRYALIRRATFDLTGLPPTVAEVEAFVKDESPDSYERLVDRLLASPHYGERMARPWLDLARYADSAGYGSDPLRFTIHPYRDWVIHAFNRNLPYDRFTVEQIAGDLLPSPTQDQLIATAFHRNTMTNTEGGTDDEEFRVAAVKDRTDVTMQAWMGLTMGCAQCHTHKFDPITQREYYSVYAVFNQTQDADRADESPKIPTPDKAQQEQRDKLAAEIAKLEAEVKASPKLDEAQAKWEKALAGRDDAWVTLVPETASATSGAKLERQSDGSLLVSGEQAKTDTYTVKVRTDLKKITAFRLEALPDESLPANGPGRAGNGSFILNEFTVTAAAAVKGDEPPGATGRFVRIGLPGKEKMLSLAEVQVFAADGSDNFAPKGKAKQSTTDFGGPPELAIDGKTDGEFDGKSVTHTAKSTDPWWELDLGSESRLDRIVLWNRTDGGLGERLANFKVSVLNAKREPVWTRTVKKAPAPSLTLSPTPRVDVTLANASATWEQPDAGGWSAGKAIDGDPSPTSGWAILPKAGVRHAAAFEAAGPVGYPGGTELTFTLAQTFETGQLGRFRLSATTAAKPVRILPIPVAEAFAVAAGERSPEQKQVVRDHFLAVSPDVKAEHAKVAALRKKLADMKVTETAIMRELPPDKRRPSHVLVKGNFLSKGDPVEPAVLGAFHPLPPGAAADRLGLAKWLVDRQNPLTARVQVNRLWAQFFGTGLVETQEDFGEQGQPPSHPELLDWLAVELVEPSVGGSGVPWDVKRLVRLIVTSATYRQSAKVEPEHLAKDARNRLLARMPRQRLEAEMVRDQALAVSGLLSRKMFGPSVYPPQPDGLWQAAFNGERTYPTSKGEDRYRRGLYTFWRRTVPYPSMQTFDAPSREVCTVRRIHTSTPLQAFVTMNDPVYVECSQALGRRIVKEGGATLEDRLRFGLMLVRQRPPTAEQVKPLAELWREEVERFRADGEGAMKLTTQPIGPLLDGADAAEMAAWTVVANVLLNLDGAMTR